MFPAGRLSSAIEGPEGTDASPTLGGSSCPFQASISRARELAEQLTPFQSMTNGLEIHGTLLARNTLLNLAGQVIPLLVGLATIPYVVKGLGNEGFGILSIAWVLLGYFTLSELGLGRESAKLNIVRYLRVACARPWFQLSLG